MKRRQGEVIELMDQNGTVHQYDYDKIGRRTKDKVTFPTGSALDQTVKRLQWAYEDRGMLGTVSSYDAASGGNVVNEVVLAYNGFGQLITDRQRHGGSVGTGTPQVAYAYTDGSANHARLTKITYPNGREVNIGYGTSDGVSRNCQREVISPRTRLGTPPLPAQAVGSPNMLARD